MEQKIKLNHWGPVVSASVKGASHKACGTCCQDAVSVKEGVFRGESYLVCSVADGHGSPAYTRSDQGAALAVLAAEQTAMQFLLDISKKHKRSPKGFERCVSVHLKETWVNNLRQALGAYHIVPDTIRKYGTTLLMALFFREHVYLAQLGDGVICAIRTSGKASFMKESEPGPISQVTDSLCGSDFKNRWAFSCVPMREIKTLLLSTDGFENSVASNEALVKWVRTLDGHMRHVTTGQIKDVLPVWLDSYSKQGSQDDVSVVVVSMNEVKHNRNGEENEQT